MVVSILALLLQVAQLPAASKPPTEFVKPVICHPEPRVVYRPDLDTALVTLTGYGEKNELASIIVAVNRAGKVLEANIERSSRDRTVDSALVKWANSHVYAASSCGQQEVFRLRIRVGVKGNA